MIGLSCVVVAYRSPVCEVREIVASVTAAGGRVLVVDNSASSQLAEALEGIRDVEYLPSAANLGYARGVNLGLSMCLNRGADVVAVANPDVRLRPESWRKLALRAASEPGIWTAPLTGDSGRVTNLRERIGQIREIESLFVGSRAYRSLAGEQPTVPHAAGALLIASATSWRQYGGFDDTFELYYEDVEFSDRLRAAGDPVRVCWSVSGVHVGGTSSQRGSSPAAYRLLRVSRTRYWRLRAPVFAFLLVALSPVEALVRSIARMPEPFGVRWIAVADQVRELLSPGSVSLLESSA